MDKMCGRQIAPMRIYKSVTSPSWNPRRSARCKSREHLVVALGCILGFELASRLCSHARHRSPVSPHPIDCPRQIAWIAWRELKAGTPVFYHLDEGSDA